MQASLSKKAAVDGHGCHTTLNFGAKAKENKDTGSPLYCLPKLHKKTIKQVILPFLVLVCVQNFLNC